MIIQLQEPFASKWSKGYLVINNQNRRNVILFNNDVDRTTISYARYLMGVKLGYFVPDHLEVDHKDDDKTNDDIDNLQLLTGEENRLKEQYNYIMNKQVRYGYHCAFCGNPFILIEAEVKKRLDTGGELAFCNRSCAAKMQHLQGNGGLQKTTSPEIIQQIKLLREQGLSSYKIADRLNISKSTACRYM